MKKDGTNLDVNCQWALWMYLVGRTTCEIDHIVRLKYRYILAECKVIANRESQLYSNTFGINKPVSTCPKP